jgi:glycosyltransferase involved in cell wall biosynthesis
LEEQFQKLGPTFRLANSQLLDPLTLSALKKRKIALVYSNTGTNGFVQRHLKELGCPIICHVHELGFSLERHFGEENFKALLATTDLFLAGSGAVADYLIGHRRISPDKVNVAYPFIDLAANRRCLEYKVPLLDIPTDAVVVGSCGIISWRKGTDLFVQMARLVLEQASRPVHFVWLGGPLTHGEYQNVRYDAEMSGIADHLTFPGSVTDHLSYFKQFDIFALPSREDPFPLVVLDAASLGLPVVCFDEAGGAPEFIEEDAGLVVPYLDVERMAAAIVRLVEDVDLRRQFGDVARAKVLARHDIKVGGRHLVEIVRSYLAPSGQEET